MSTHERASVWSDLSGLAFAALLVAGMAPLGDLIGSFGDSDATFVKYFADSANRTGAILGGVLVGLAAVAFLFFLANLRDTLESSGLLPRVAGGAGITFVVLLLIATACLVTVPFARAFGGAFNEDAVLESGEAILPQLGYVILAVYAMWAAATLILAATISSRRTGNMPRWLWRLGFVAAGFVFRLGPSVVGILGVPAWAAAVSVASLASSRGRRSDLTRL